MDHGVLAVGADTSCRLESGMGLRGVRGVTIRREFESSRKSQTCPLQPSRNPSRQLIQLHWRQRPPITRKEHRHFETSKHEVDIVTMSLVIKFVVTEMNTGASSMQLSARVER